MPNESIVDEPLTTFTTPLEAIEKLTGTKFLQFLQKHKVHIGLFKNTYVVSGGSFDLLSLAHA